MARLRPRVSFARAVGHAWPAATSLEIANRLGRLSLGLHIWRFDTHSSPTSSLSLAAASISPAATAGSEVVFAIFSSAAAASRAW